MRILYVLEHFHPYIGGVEFLFWQLTTEMAKAGHQIQVVTTQFDNSLAKYESIDGVEIFRVKCGNRYSFSIRSIPLILKQVKNCDFIHTSTYNAAIPAWVVSKLKSKKCIITFHEYWGKLWWSLPYLNFMQRVMYNSFEKLVSFLDFYKIIAVSNYTRESLLKAGIREEKLLRIYNGINYEKFESDKPSANQNMDIETKYFTFIGRLGVSKGLDLLLASADRILEENKSIEIKVIIPTMPTSMMRKIKKEIKFFKNKERLVLLHNLSKKTLISEIQSSDFVVVPSYSEGFCFVAAEVCALGTPIVSSQKGALKEVVSGKFIPMESQSVDGLYSAIKKALNNEWETKESVKFPLHKSVESYICLYEELLEN